LDYGIWTHVSVLDKNWIRVFKEAMEIIELYLGEKTAEGDIK